MKDERASQRGRDEEIEMKLRSTLRGKDGRETKISFSLSVRVIDSKREKNEKYSFDKI